MYSTENMATLVQSIIQRYYKQVSQAPVGNCVRPPGLAVANGRTHGAVVL